MTWNIEDPACKIWLGYAGCSVVNQQNNWGFKQFNLKTWQKHFLSKIWQKSDFIIEFWKKPKSWLMNSHYPSNNLPTNCLGMVLYHCTPTSKHPSVGYPIVSPWHFPIKKTGLSKNGLIPCRVIHGYLLGIRGYHLVMTFTVCHGKIHHAIKNGVYHLFR